MKIGIRWHLESSFLTTKFIISINGVENKVLKRLVGEPIPLPPSLNKGRGSKSKRGAKPLSKISSSPLKHSSGYSSRIGRCILSMRGIKGVR
jgi:hypothetical protein